MNHDIAEIYWAPPKLISIFWGIYGVNRYVTWYSEISVIGPGITDFGGIVPNVLWGCSMHRHIHYGINGINDMDIVTNIMFVICCDRCVVINITQYHDQSHQL